MLVQVHRKAHAMMVCSITPCFGAASACWRVAGALAAGAAVVATFGIGARDLLALDASADARYMAVPLARVMYQRAWRYHISSGCEFRHSCVGMTVCNGASGA